MSTSSSLAKRSAMHFASVYVSPTWPLSSFAPSSTYLRILIARASIHEDKRFSDFERRSRDSRSSLPLPQATSFYGIETA